MMLRNSAFLLACLVQLSAVNAVSAQTDRPVAAELAPSTATATEAYLDQSSDEIQKMLKVMRAFMRDQKNLEKGMAVMYAVKSFEEPDWESILAETKRLSDRVRSVAGRRA